MNKTEKTPTPYQLEKAAKKEHRATVNASFKANDVKLDAKKSAARGVASLPFRTGLARLAAFVNDTEKGIAVPDAQKGAWEDAVKTYVFKDEDEKGKAVYSALPNKTAPSAAQVNAICAVANIVWKHQAVTGAAYTAANDKACDWADKSAEREAEAAKKREERKAKEIEKAKALLAENGLKVVA